MSKIFDGTIDEFDKEIKICSLSNCKITLSSLITNSKNLLDNNVISKNSSIINQIYSDNLGSFYGPDHLSVYLYEFNRNQIIIFEFGEKQPGRYILNQLAVIEGQ